MWSGWEAGAVVDSMALPGAMGLEHLGQRAALLAGVVIDASGFAPMAQARPPAQ